MRVHRNGRPLNGHRREVEFGYSRESAAMLTETTITWQGHTKLGGVRVKDVYRVDDTITSRTIISVAIKYAYSLPSSLGGSAKNDLVAEHQHAATAIAWTRHIATARR
jgi:hypothetical protein